MKVQQGAARPSLLRHPDFMKLWTAETISQFGTQVSLLAIPLVAALILQVPPFEFGLLTAIEYLPFLIVSLPAGVWVDRLRRRPILIVADLGRGAALLSIPVAHLFGLLTIWQLYVVAFVVGCLTVFFDVAYQSYLPSIVHRNAILEGNSKLEVSRSAAQIAGPGMAGIVIGVLTAPVAIFLDSISYVISGAFVYWIRRPETPPGQPAGDGGASERRGMPAEIGEGLRYVLTHRYLRNIAATTATANFFGNMAFAILILYLVRDFGLTAELLGAALSIGSVGFLLGALLANRIGQRLGVGPTIVASTLIFGPAALPVAFATPELAVPAVALTGFLGGFGGAIYNINQVSLRQAITPARMQGRMNATMRFIVWGTIPVGAVIGGVLGEVIGLRETIWVGALGGLFAFLPVLLSPVRHIREMPEPEQEREPTGAADDERTPAATGSATGGEQPAT